tara:strand:+ start:161 stop:523 length:363 start_codon:yes stop_codon:yes gene_type:complete
MLAGRSPMQEPWYQSAGPNDDIVFAEFHRKFPKHPIIVNKVVTKEKEKCGGFGSWRGYYTFTQKTIDFYIKLAIINQKKKIVNRFIMNYMIWPKYMEKFYAPGGKGYELAKKHYEKKCYK